MTEEITLEYVQSSHPQYIQPYGITPNFPLYPGMYVKNLKGDLRYVKQILIKNNKIRYILEKPEFNKN
jgi:hypothetical protein